MFSASYSVLCLMAVLALMSVWVNARRMVILPDNALQGRMRLSERLMLAGKFCEPLNLGIRNSLLYWAERIETDLARRAVLRNAMPPARAMSGLTSGYRLAAQAETHPETHNQLKVMASQALTRLNLCVAMIGGLTLLTLTSLVLGDRKIPPSIAQAKFGLATVVGVFWVWELLDLGAARLGQAVLSQSLNGIFRGIALAGFSYAVTALLVVTAGRRWGWKPSLRGGFGWIGPGFLLCLTCVTGTGWLVESSFGAPLPLPPLVVYLLLHASPSEVLKVSLLACLVAPLFEELVFRSWLLGGLLPHLDPWKATLLSSLLFSLSHGDAAHTPELFVLGMILSWVYVRSGSLGAAATVHAMWNLWAMCDVVANGV